MAHQKLSILLSLSVGLCIGYYIDLVPQLMNVEDAHSVFRSSQAVSGNSVVAGISSIYSGSGERGVHRVIKGLNSQERNQIQDSQFDHTDPSTLTAANGFANEAENDNRRYEALDPDHPTPTALNRGDISGSSNVNDEAQAPHFSHSEGTAQVANVPETVATDVTIDQAGDDGSETLKAVHTPPLQGDNSPDSQTYTEETINDSLTPFGMLGLDDKSAELTQGDFEAIEEKWLHWMISNTLKREGKKGLESLSKKFLHRPGQSLGSLQPGGTALRGTQSPARTPFLVSHDVATEMIADAVCTLPPFDPLRKLIHHSHEKIGVTSASAEKNNADEKIFAAIVFVPTDNTLDDADKQSENETEEPAIQILPNRCRPPSNGSELQREIWYRGRFDREWQVSTSDIIRFSEDNYDFLFVECPYTAHQMAFPLPPRPLTDEQKLRRKPKNRMKARERRSLVNNVIVLFVDAVSREHFQTQFPKSIQYLKSLQVTRAETTEDGKYKEGSTSGFVFPEHSDHIAFDFQRHTILGRNSVPNYGAIYSGMEASQFQDGHWKDLRRASLGGLPRHEDSEGSAADHDEEVKSEESPRKHSHATTATWLFDVYESMGFDTAYIDDVPGGYPAETTWRSYLEGLNTNYGFAVGQPPAYWSFPQDMLSPGKWHWPSCSFQHIEDSPNSFRFRTLERDGPPSPSSGSNGNQTLKEGQATQKIKQTVGTYMNNMNLCVAQQAPMHHAFDYLKAFLKSHRDRKKFVSMVINEAHEPGQHLVSIDNDLVTMLQFLLQKPSWASLWSNEPTGRDTVSLTDDFALVLMSDHGIHYGWDFETYEGSAHHKNPFLYTVLPQRLITASSDSTSPSKLRGTSGSGVKSTLLETLLHNQASITTHFDVHETLLNLAYGNAGYEEAKKGYVEERQRIREQDEGSKDSDQKPILENFAHIYGRSLLDTELPYTRTCKDAGVPAGFCPCDRVVSCAGVDENEVKEKVALAFNRAIRTNLKTHGDLPMTRGKSFDNSASFATFSSAPFICRPFFPEDFHMTAQSCINSRMEGTVAIRLQHLALHKEYEINFIVGEKPKHQMEDTEHENTAESFSLGEILSISQISRYGSNWDVCANIIKEELRAQAVNDDDVEEVDLRSDKIIKKLRPIMEICYCGEEISVPERRN